MQKQYKFIPRDQLVQGKQYYLHNDATCPATFVGRDEESIYFKCHQQSSFVQESEGPFKGCLAFDSSLGDMELQDDGFIEVDSEQ